MVKTKEDQRNRLRNGKFQAASELRNEVQRERLPRLDNTLMTSSFTRTLKLKVRPESYRWLSAAAIEVNQVFNYVNETSFLAATRTDLKRKWLSGFDLCSLTAGASEFFERIGADTIHRICVEYAQKRTAAKRRKLRWRVSHGARRSLGWVPFKAANLKRKGRALRFCGKTFRVFEAERLDGVNKAASLRIPSGTGGCVCRLNTRMS